MAVVTLTSSYESYGEENFDSLYKNDGTKTLAGIDFGDIETGKEYDPTYIYLRHDGLEPIYDAGYYIRAIGIEWGGYVSDADTAHIPYNPNWFKHGGMTEAGFPTTSTLDYELLRTSALNNPEMGLRVHYDRENPFIRTDGLGSSNKGLNFSPITIKPESLDYSLTANPELDGYVYPEPIDEAILGRAGDELKLGLSLKLPEDIEGSGHIQFSFAVKYRYTN